MIRNDKDYGTILAVGVDCAEKCQGTGISLDKKNTYSYLCINVTTTVG